MLHRRLAVTRPYFAWTLGLVLLFSLLGPLPERAQASHGECVLDVFGGTPGGQDGGPDSPSASDPTADIHDHNVGDSHTMTARLILATPDAFGFQTCVPNGIVNIDFENESGANDTDGTTRQSPDLTCSIFPSDFTASCFVGYTGRNPGTDIWRGWIDHDSVQSTDESDQAEGVNEITQPGTGGDPILCAGVLGTQREPDCTDVVQVNWGAGLHNLDCDDSNPPDTEREANPSRAGSASNEVYTCTTRSAFGGLVHGGSGTLSVYGEVEGSSTNTVNDPDPQDGSSYRSPDYKCDISESGATLGTCQITITQVENEDGTAEICFWATFKQDPDVPGGAGEDGERACTGSSPASPFNSDNTAETTGEAQQPDKSDVGNDTADAVELSWGIRQSNQLDAEPEAQTVEINTQATITATIFDQFGVALENPNRVINFEFFQGSITDRDGNTPQTPDGSCNPNASSTCSFTYGGPAGPGFDLVCVWINTTPTMNGNNTGGNGTCDNEQLNDNDDDINVADGQGQDDDRDVVQVQWVDASAATRIDCAPETSSGLPGSSNVITCSATNSQGATVAQTPIDVEAVGANDPDASNTPLSPDFTCITGGDGSCAVQHGPSGTAQNGVTTYRAWVDTDNNNASTEIDAGEPRDETANPGDRPEPDGTDVVERTWGGTVARLSISPKNDTALIGTCNAFTVTASDINNVGLAGLVIDVEQRHERANNGTANDEPTVSFCTPATADGANPSNVDQSRGDLQQPSENPDNLGTAGGETIGTTDSQGRITFGIRVASGQGSDGAGNVGVVAFYESSDNDDPDPTDPQDPANKLWSTTGSSPTSAPTSTTNPTTNPTTGTGGRRLTLTATKNRVKFDSTFTLNGRLEGTTSSTSPTCLQGVTVAIQRDVHGGTQEFVDYGSATTSTGGAFSVNFRADKNASYVARVLENNPPGCGAATSSPEQVLVQVRVALAASRKVITSGRRVTLTARVRPCEGHENDTITLMRKDGSRPFRKVATARSDGSCVARFRGRLTNTAIFKAKWTKQDEDHTTGRSGRVRVRTR